MRKEINIDENVIGDRFPAFLIAEAGVNHNGDLEIAKKLIDLAAKSRVDAVKFQTFNPEKLMLKSTPKVSYQKETTNKEENFYEMIKKYVFSLEEFKVLKEYCEKKGLVFLSTPFDEDSVSLLENLGVSAYKIGSGDMNNLQLLKLICLKGKPIFLSTGMSTFDEVKESVNFIKSNENS